mgnify:FL=1|jgi:hypothetical protein
MNCPICHAEMTLPDRRYRTHALYNCYCESLH